MTSTKYYKNRGLVWLLTKLMDGYFREKLSYYDAMQLIEESKTHE